MLEVEQDLIKLETLEKERVKIIENWKKLNADVHTLIYNLCAPFQTQFSFFVQVSVRDDL